MWSISWLLLWLCARVFLFITASATRASLSRTWVTSSSQTHIHTHTHSHIHASCSARAIIIIIMHVQPVDDNVDVGMIITRWLFCTARFYLRKNYDNVIFAPADPNCISPELYGEISCSGGVDEVGGSITCNCGVVLLVLRMQCNELLCCQF